MRIELQDYTLCIVSSVECESGVVPKEGEFLEVQGTIWKVTKVTYIWKDETHRIVLSVDEVLYDGFF